MVSQRRCAWTQMGHQQVAVGRLNEVVYAGTELPIPLAMVGYQVGRNQAFSTSGVIL